MYEVGEIFIDDEEYSKRVEWCKVNNCYIEEITQPDDVVRHFQIQEDSSRDVIFPELEVN